MNLDTAADHSNRLGKDSEIRALRARLQDIIADTDDGMLEPLMESLGALEPQLLKPPGTGLIMMKFNGCGTVFYLGEVLVTEAHVSCRGITGYGCCMGERFDGAVALACLDALAQVEPAAEMDGIRSAIDRLCREVLQKREMDADMAAVTRVDFCSMAEE